MTQDKRERTGVRTNCCSAKSKTYDQRAKKKLSATLLCLLETEDELSNIHWDSVSLTVKEWLTSSFAKEKGCEKKPEGNTHIRTVSYSDPALVWKERKFRVPSSPCGVAYPEEVIAILKDVDQWSFNIFALSEASGRKSLKYILCELFCKYNLLSQFKIPLTVLLSFAEALEVGYNKHQNLYHNSTHAADVTQTVHSFIIQTGMMHWFTDLEILALIFSASIHDYEHTGTTNHFHIQTRSEAAVLYNDKSVLENHHVSAVYQLLQNQEVNILANLTEVQWRELRQLVITMVLATDISQHFHHMGAMRQVLCCLQQRERPDKLKVMCMILHAADMSHPSKFWELHHQWAEAAMEELFRQGDKEAELGMPVSSFCDRKTTNIAECQLAYIDIMVQPIFTLLFGVVEKIVAFLKNEASKSGCFPSSKESSQNSSQERKGQNKHRGNDPTEESGNCTERYTLIILDIPSFKANLMEDMEINRKNWKGTLREGTTREESPGKESKKAKDQVSKGKAEGGKTQKASQDKPCSAHSKKYCVAAQSPTTCSCDCQLCDETAFAPLDVNFIVYNADSSELLQSHQDSSDAMEVTESYEELVDNEISWRKAAGQNINANIQEMRGMVPKSKPLGPNESDDVIIEEVIPDDPQAQPTSKQPTTTGQDGAQHPPNVGCVTTNLTQSDMEIFSLWNEEVMRRAAEQQKQAAGQQKQAAGQQKQAAGQQKQAAGQQKQAAGQQKQQQDQSRMPPDAGLQVKMKQNEDSQRREGALPACSSPPTFVLQVISIDAPSVTCEIERPNCNPCRQEVTNTPPNQTNNNNITPANTGPQNETNPCAAVSVTSLNYGVFKIPE